MADEAIYEKICNKFKDEGLSATSWSNGPHETYAVHEHRTHKVLYVAEGAITFTLHKGGKYKKVVMKPCDRLDIPPHTPHSAVVGPDGVSCIEAHK